MDDIVIPSADDPDRAYKLAAAQFDVPAFVKRARNVQEALESLRARCRKFRDEALLMVRLNVGRLKALAGGWPTLCQALAEVPPLPCWEQLEAELKPQLRLPLSANPSPRVLRKALREMVESLRRFDKRWRGFVAKLDLGPVNKLIESYNRWYTFEKECFVRSPQVARQGFEPLPLITAETVLGWFPRLAAGFEEGKER